MSHTPAIRFVAKHMLAATETGADLDWSKLRERAADEGLQLSEQELAAAAAAILAELGKAGELGDEELDAVAGGTTYEQKADQTYTLLSSVMKSMTEMRTAVIRNML
jgi:hypothetical protein